MEEEFALCHRQQQLSGEQKCNCTEAEHVRWKKKIVYNFFSRLLNFFGDGWESRLFLRSSFAGSGSFRVLLVPPFLHPIRKSTLRTEMRKKWLNCSPRNKIIISNRSRRFCTKAKRRGEEKNERDMYKRIAVTGWKKQSNHRVTMFSAGWIELTFFFAVQTWRTSEREKSTSFWWNN